jgi:DNA (cytosine-5)-methyltransferase 1
LKQPEQEREVIKLLKHLDLFSGIGGFSLGLERTGGFKTVAFCDNDKHTHNVLRKHWPNVPIYDDVTTLKGEDIGAVDIISGGFPCQDLSVAGKGAGLAGARSGLWWQFHRLIKETQPKYVIAENVSALRSRGLDQVLRSLFEIGYDAEWHCIPASAVGAPHQRDRIWILAHPRHRSGGNLWSTEAGENTQSEWTTDSGSISGSGGESTSVAYSSGEGLEGFGVREVGSEQKESMPTSSSGIVRRIDKSDFWETEPNVGRVADGVPNRAHRLKQLGNSLVPQIPEMIGNAILQYERSLK